MSDPPSMITPERMERKWSRLAMVWALYYLAAYTLGKNPQYMRTTIWLGGSLVALVTIPMFWRHIRLRQLPREGVLLGLFLLWTLTGLFVVKDQALFERFLKLITELILLVVCISWILKYSGAVKWFHLAFLGVAVLQIFSSSDPIGMDAISKSEVVSRIDAANAVGFLCFMGVLGAFGYFLETQRLWFRSLLIAGGLLAVYGVVLSSSRSAFSTLIVIGILWPTMCLMGDARLKMKSVLGALAVLFIAYFTYQFIIQETYMGVRFSNATQMEDNSTQERFGLVLISARVLTASPVFGCGLGQFGIASGTGFFAHNEVAEIISTTGLPGFLLYYSVYLVAWRRLSRSLRCLHDPLVRYRINIARMSLLVLLISGALSRINFLSQESMFLLAISVGMAHWAERMAQLACRGAGLGVVFAQAPQGFPRWGSPPGTGAARAFGQPAMNSWEKTP